MTRSRAFAPELLQHFLHVVVVLPEPERTSERLGVPPPPPKTCKETPPCCNQAPEFAPYSFGTQNHWFWPNGSGNLTQKAGDGLGFGGNRAMAMKLNRGPTYQVGTDIKPYPNDVHQRTPNQKFMRCKPTDPSNRGLFALPVPRPVFSATAGSFESYQPPVASPTPRMSTGIIISSMRAESVAMECLPANTYTTLLYHKAQKSAAFHLTPLVPCDVL